MLFNRVNEAQEAQSTKDFISKLSISLKEARETKYWLELLIKTDYLSSPKSNSILEDLTEIIKLLTSIIKTTKSRRYE